MRIVATVAALLVAAGALASQPAAKGPERPLLGVVWNGNAAAVAPLDATTLEPAGTALPIKDVGPFGYSPDHSQFALGGTRLPVVRFVDVTPLRLVRTVRLARSGSVERIAWLGPGAAVVLYAQPEGTRIAWIDPTSGKVEKRARLGVVPYQAAIGAGRLVLLLPPRKGIGTARLEIVGAASNARVVRLPKVRIGSTMPQARTVFRRIEPGLALDVSTGHAYVVGTNGVVAAVDLLSRRVSYHSLAPRSLAPAKALAGQALDAQSLGGGLLAVAGTSYSATVDKSGETQSATPLGLRIVDTRTWTQRTIDSGADGFAVGGSGLLAYGIRSEFGTTTKSIVAGMGVAAYGTDGSARFHLVPSTPVGWVQVKDDFAYCWVDDATAPSWHVVVLDLTAGTVVRELRLAHPTRLLITDSSAF